MSEFEEIVEEIRNEMQKAYKKLGTLEWEYKRARHDAESKTEGETLDSWCRQFNGRSMSFVRLRRITKDGSLVWQVQVETRTVVTYELSPEEATNLSLPLVGEKVPASIMQRAFFLIGRKIGACHANEWERGQHCNWRTGVKGCDAVPEIWDRSSN